MNPNQMSEDEQLAAVNRHGWNIEDISNPSEAVQLAAVQTNGTAIKYISNPSEAVQLAAVTQNGWAIYYILDKGIHPSNQIIFSALTHSYVLDDKEYYDKLVKEIFPNNSLLAKKWIRYGDNHRSN